MKKNLFKRLAVSVAALGLVATMQFPAMAALTEQTFEKALKKDADAYAPNTTFTFTVAPAAATTVAGEGLLSYAGVAGGVTVTDQAVFGPAKTYNSVVGGLGLTNISENFKLSFDATQFTAPGTYHYTLTEANGGYDGITYDTVAKDLYVFVQNNAGGTGYEVSSVILAKGNVGTASNKITKIENDYAVNAGDPNNGTHELKVSKTVTGNQGDRAKDFSFKIKVEGANGEMYKVVKGGNTLAPITSGTEATYTLKHGENFVVYGLSKADKYTVEEVIVATDGYTTTATLDAANTTLTNGKTGETTQGTANRDLAYTNDKNVVTPTGIAVSFAPYILLVLFAGVAGKIFMGRRKIEE